MTNNKRVSHARGFSLSLKQAKRAVEEGSAVWIVENVIIRAATLAESIAKRNEVSKESEPIANAEIPGLVFKQPPTASVSAHDRRELIIQANRLCEA